MGNDDVERQRIQEAQRKQADKWMEEIDRLTGGGEGKAPPSRAPQRTPTPRDFTNPFKGDKGNGEPPGQHRGQEKE